ncbi:MAG: hypothetical protein AB4352_13975 [Hormoscilla sp.]
MTAIDIIKQELFRGIEKLPATQLPDQKFCNSSMICYPLRIRVFTSPQQMHRKAGLAIWILYQSSLGRLNRVL